EELGYSAKLGDLVDAPWPKVDATALVQDEIELVLQVNGKLRGKLTVAADADNSAIEAAAMASAPVQKILRESPVATHEANAHIGGRVIIVPGRLVNVVLPKGVPA
ncbi:MAG TPA: hypothetical protein VN989_14450, partial [Casimicrobiaceae bacterium]|nr:hypothetical protein [Casimicrobiaceae bacterium]